MILRAFCVFDDAVKGYLPPFFCRAKGEAIRSFSDAVNQSEHQFAKHRKDYVLMELGEFDDSTGLFVGIASGPSKVVSALEVYELVVGE